MLENSNNSSGKQFEEMKNDFEKRLKQISFEKEELNKDSSKKINELRTEIELLKNINKGIIYIIN